MRAFLSHSSKDKDFVRQVAEILGPLLVEYDERTFDYSQPLAVFLKGKKHSCRNLRSESLLSDDNIKLQKTVLRQQPFFRVGFNRVYTISLRELSDLIQIALRERYKNGRGSIRQ